MRYPPDFFGRLTPTGRLSVIAIGTTIEIRSILPSPKINFIIFNILSYLFFLIQPLPLHVLIKTFASRFSIKIMVTYIILIYTI